MMSKANVLTLVSIVVGVLSIAVGILGIIFSDIIQSYFLGDVSVGGLSIFFLIIGCILVGIFVVLIFHNYEKINYRVRRLSLPFLSRLLMVSAPQHEYKFTTATYSYKYVERWRMQNCMDMRVKVLSDSFSGIHLIQKWTGTAEGEMGKGFFYHVEGREYKISEDPGSRNRMITDGFAHYKISLTNTRDVVQRGRILNNICVTSEVVEDAERTSKPYFSKTISMPADVIILEMCFNKCIADSVIGLCGQVFTHAVDVIPYLTVPASEITIHHDSGDEGEVVYRWEIRHPVYGGKYIMSWEFPSEELSI